MIIRENFFLAIKYHQTGDIGTAAHICTEILNVQPHFVPALHLLGVIFYQQGDYDSAIEHIRQALCLNQNNPDAHNHLGSALKAKGEFEEAIRCYHKAIELNPNLTEAFFNLGNALVARGQVNKSIQYYQKAIALQPTFFAAYYNLGNSFRDQGKLDEAIVAYQKSLELHPEDTNVYNALGTIFQEQGQLDQAIILLKKAVELNPHFAWAYSNLGKILQDNGSSDQALSYYKMALQQHSDPVALCNIYNNIGVIYQEKGEFNKAISSYQKALALDPSSSGIYKNLGTIFHDIGCFEEAISYYRQALELNPGDTELYCNMGSVLQDKEQFDEALIFYKRALEINPGLAEAHWNTSLMLLSQGNFREGWEKYEWRLLKKGAHSSIFLLPTWKGGSLKGIRLLVTAEQGVGDEIMFASCLSDILEKAKSCVIECDRRLLPLFSRSFPKGRFFERITKEGVPPDISADFQIRIGSLPKLIRQALIDFPKRRSYLVPDEQKVALWSLRYRELGEGLKIGISWRGGSKPSVRLARSTSLHQWSKLFCMSGVNFINLQYGDCMGDLKEAKEKLGVTIYDWEDANPLEDLDNFAAQVAALDLVISVDNATVHISGALGTQVLALLPNPCDWRWMHKFEDTPWYKTVRLFRQRRQGDWDEVFDRALLTLKRFVESNVLSDIDSKNSHGR
ncbi:MAG: tetratricopeptide repeat protein [Thermodesulfovibrionales bacterium]|nr:tetratricopeptide repeat protein [Thermodesulfovibrionales bacterium]